MGHSKGYCLGHSRVIHEDGFDFLRRYFFPTTINDLLKASSKKQIAVSIEIPLVARSEPAMRESVLIRRGIIRVTLHDCCTSHDSFTDVLRGQQGAICVHNGHFWAYRYPYRTALP